MARVNKTTGRGTTAACAAVAALLAAARPAAAGDLVRYDSKYYTLYTDVGDRGAKEAICRMTRMADEYRDRTRGFAGQLRGKFPFYLYSEAADYHAAGGIDGSAGVFIGTGKGGTAGATGKLMAIAGHRLTADTWHTVQHEGFHQFAHAVIGGDFPTWLNEGLAEYFGEGVYTGDGFVVGVVPPWRLQRVQQAIRGGKVKGVVAMMNVSAGQWERELDIANYDQAWSMVHFLVHADNGRYAPALSQCIRELSAGHTPEVAWADAIGSTDGFDEKWKAYWLAQPKSPTAQLYGRATVATLTSFLARATAQKQAFADVDAFAAAARADQLKMSADDWLPRSLLTDALRRGQLDGDDATAGPGWSLGVGANKQPTLSATAADGCRLTGSFVLVNGRVASVFVEVDDVTKVIADATAVRDGGKKDQARQMVQAAMRQHPRSPAAAAAAAFVRSCR